MVYASEHLSLAVLEILVHLESDDLPNNLIAYRLDLPDGLVERLEEVPDDWLADPLRRQSRRYGDTWAVEQRSVALAVPSAIVPSESNVLLNPLHPRFGEVRIVDQFPFALDHRLQ